MLQKDQSIYVGLVTKADQMVFHPATIAQAPGDGFVAECEQPIEAAETGEFAAGSSVAIYFEHRNKFMRLAAHVDAIIADDKKFTFGFTTAGEPVLAESRACYRAVTVTEDITATINGDDVCNVLDVSATGCSLRSKQSYEIGESVRLAFEHLGKEYRGAATVRSIKPLGRNDFRYGLCCPEGTSSPNALHDCLRIIAAEVQRKQLKRLAGAA